ncbi:MAG: Gfo/Idh/MocA family oxidoreductase [Planctomycetota bacterium]|nr:Gfo/Idh/MocA family oxidoreductase [Planctomycetota bacterium]
MKSINVGLVGIGSNWWERYEPVLRALRDRLCVRAVFDHVTTRANAVAELLQATTMGGVLALVERPDVDAVLVLSPGWHEHALLDFICSKGKPVYLGVRPVNDLLSIDHLHSITVLTDTPVMPEFDRRYEPATSRVQELLASRLGRPHRIGIQVEQPISVTCPNPTLPLDLFVELFDWCRYIARTPPASLTAVADSDDNLSGITLRFHRPKSGDEPVVAQIDVRHCSTRDIADSSASAAFAIEASGGRIEFSTQESIRWQSADGSFDEELSHDRGAVEVMLDHFCRRVVGGLIPVPDLGDICSGLRLADAVDESLRTQTTVEFARGL